MPTSEVALAEVAERDVLQTGAEHEGIDHRWSLAGPLATIVTLVLTQPYLMWFGRGTGSDVQPYPFVLSLVVIAVLAGHRSLRLSLPVAALLWFIVLLLALQVQIGGVDLYYLVRGSFGYLSIVTMVVAWRMLLLASGREHVARGLKISFWLWTAAGAAQMVSPAALTFWRDKLIQTADRGSLSFATEPAYFAIAVLMLAVAIELLDPAHSPFYLLTAWLVCVGIANSTVGAVYATVAVVIVSRIRLRTLVAAALTMSAALVILMTRFQGLRITRLLSTAADDPASLLTTDPSTASRFLHVALPVQAFIKDRGIPHGLYAWSDYDYGYAVYARYFGGYVWGGASPGDVAGRILSIHGQLLFELGVLSIFVYVALWLAIRHHPRALRYYLLFMVLFLNGLTLNSPFFALVVACLMVPTLLESVRRPASPAHVESDL